MDTGQYKFQKRAFHSSIVIRDNLYCWGGVDDDLPLVHDNEEKKKFTSSVDIFHLPASKWERESTTGTPPSGVFNYACTSIGNSIYYFGGNCKGDDCYHNNLYELNTITNKWGEIVNSTPDNVPMRKSSCGMISFNINGKDKLLLVGGLGPKPVTTHSHSQYVPNSYDPNVCYTNETHLMCVSSSPGQWIVPVITGTRPPPCAFFTIHTLPGNKGVMFGGNTIDETGIHPVDDVFLLTCSQDTIDFQKVVRSADSRVKWPKRRCFHASTIINTISSNKQDTFHLLVLGGKDENGEPHTDCWILNLSSLKWFQIDVPESVTNRYCHSLSTFYISKHCIWIVVTGGLRDDDDDDDDDDRLVTDPYITMIVELEYINEEWIVKHVWNNEQLMNNKNEIQKSLIHHIVDDRLQEGTLVTDLISLIKSPFTTPQQLETQRILEKKIFEKETEILKLSVETREKSDEITHLKTREMSLIDKSDTLEKELGFSKDEAQTYKKMAITTRQELQDFQTLLMIEKKTSLVKSQELDFSTKQITDLKGKLKHTPVLSPDEENMETMEMKIDYQEREPGEEEKIKPVDEDQLTSDISSHDKMIILQEENESYQKIVASKNEQVDELQNMLETKEERVKELETQLTGKTKTLQNDLESLHTTVVSKTKQMETKLNSLNLQMEEFKKIDELRISSSHNSEVIKYQRDAAVQFSYMIPVTDHLDGVHVAGETLFLIQGDKPQSLNWEEYGFRLHIPRGTISPSDTCEVVVKALVGGRFQFPEGTELVSAVYAVAFAKKLLEPVEMEIQHCVLLTNEEQGKSLSFVSTAKNRRDNPNKFEFVEGGVFKPGKRYASIQRIHYCENAIVEQTTPPPSTPTPPPPPPPSDQNESSEDEDDIVKPKPQMKNKRSYTGQIYYKRKGYNKWQMKFIVVRDIDAFMKYVSTKYHNAEEDELIRFTFLDPVDGYIELVLGDIDQVTSQGWNIEPHKEPLRLMKRDVDLYGSQDLKLPPSCILSVWTESSLKPKTRLSHPVPLSGIDSNTRKIYVHRYVDPVEISSSTSETTSLVVQNKDNKDGATPNIGTDISHVDTSQVITCIELVMEKNHANLCRLFKGSLVTVANELLQVGMITRDVQTAPTNDMIISCFLAGFAFKTKLEDVEKHCVKFLNVFQRIGGPFVDAADMIKQTIQETVRDRLGVQLNINI